MHSLEKKTPREDRSLNPSFSSTLLDQIYRSIDEGERKSSEMKFYRETTVKKHNGKSFNRSLVEQQGNTKDKRVGLGTEHHRDHDQDVLFFSSTSISSDSSSASDTDSMYGVRSRASRASCFAPPRPKPVTVTNEKQATRMFDGFCHSSKAKDEEALLKSKSRALKIYHNLKKVKQPISPGGKLTSFLNSLFATGNAKKTERKAKSVQASSCSSASSFSRSCLRKTLSSERDKLSNGVKRTVRFYENRPCGHNCLYEEEGKGLMMPVSVPTAWKIRRSPTMKNKKEEAAREFLEEYRHKQNKNDLVLKDFPLKIDVNDNGDEDDDDDDAASYASSDLFELDHLAVLGNGRYCEELPVYETTHVGTNRAIANGLIM